MNYSILQNPHFCILISHLNFTYCTNRHSDEMIERLESAGLGFFIKIEETRLKLGWLKIVYDYIPYCLLTVVVTCL